MPTFDLTKLLGWFLNPKNWLYLALAAILSWGAYKGYNWIFDRGYNERSEEVVGQIRDLTKERDDAVANYNKYKGEYDTWVRTTKNAQEQYMREQAAELKATQERLAAAEEAARNKPVTIKEVIKYVPVEVDAAYRLPAGLVRLYVDTLEGGSAPGAGTQLPGSYPFDAGEASGIAMSQFGQIVASNNAECVLRGKVIEEWQNWYVRNKTAFDAIIKWQKENGPKPADNGDKSPSNAIAPAPAFIQ